MESVFDDYWLTQEDELKIFVFGRVIDGREKNVKDRDCDNNGGLTDVGIGYWQSCS